MPEGTWLPVSWYRGSQVALHLPTGETEVVGTLSQAEVEKRLFWGRNVLRSADSLVQGMSPRMAYVTLTSGFGRDPPLRGAVVCSWLFLATCRTRARGGPLRTFLGPPRRRDESSPVKSCVKLTPASALLESTEQWTSCWLWKPEQ